MALATLPTRLTLETNQREELCQIARSAHPNEACGVLLGEALPNEFRLARVVPAENRAVSPRNSFLLDPMALVSALALARRAGLSLIGFYHSHPGQPGQLTASARPSPRDIAEAAWPETLSLILALGRDGQTELRAWWIRGPGSEPVPVALAIHTARIESEAGDCRLDCRSTPMDEIPHTAAPERLHNRAEPELEAEDHLRYARHLALPEVGVAGQRRLKAARILVIGAGGLGSPVALYLAAAGVGTLGLVDFDRVDLTNLQRQILHQTADVGRPKVDSATDKLLALNPALVIDRHTTQLTSANALEILADYDIILDGTDNFPTRYLVNDACVLLGKPLVYGSIFRFEGQASVFHPPTAPCYRCLFPEPPPPNLVPNCAEGGVLGVLPGIVGTIQATEALKLVLGIGDSLAGRLLLIDALSMRFREVRLRRNPDCPVCGSHPTITSLIDYNQFCGLPAHNSKEDKMTNGIPQMTVQELKRKRDQGEEFLLLDVREPYEVAIAHIGGHLVPINDLPNRVGELDRDKEIVVHCLAGGRSQRAAEFLRQSGFSRVSNLAGGIRAWSEEIDPAVPKY